MCVSIFGKPKVMRYIEGLGFGESIDNLLGSNYEEAEMEGSSSSYSESEGEDRGGDEVDEMDIEGDHTECAVIVTIKDIMEYTRYGCPIELHVKLDFRTGLWYVEDFYDVHNH
ncbi:hypothetical protein VNO77_43259 [Canavalia gladiata]|uniref:Uncharacterized protein n=1 Tax=Canavalia gladiata TaxID=3824 RepID=A0AAN9JW08_CANGL